MPSQKDHLVNHLLLPELKFVNISSPGVATRILTVEKTTSFEICPYCANKCFSIYDHVYQKVKDAPLRHKLVYLKIRKRRFRCKSCKKIFREPIKGIFKGFRTSQRFRKHVMWCASQFSCLSEVSRTCNISSWFVYKAFYEQLDLEIRKYQTPWPRVLGIDEHSLMHHEKYGFKEFVTVFVDYDRKKVRELSFGRYAPLLKSDENLLKIRARENVKWVVMDLSHSFKNYVLEMFPNAKITADKFHVIKLLSGAVQKHIKLLKDDKVIERRGNPLKQMILLDRRKLDYSKRFVLDEILKHTPELSELYQAKEAIMNLYRIRGYNQARRAFIKLTDYLAHSKLKEIKTFRRTLMRWREEILNYFTSRITNARTEGFNQKAKLVQRCAYGFKNRENYRRKILYTCRS
ncbi:MAG: ISL3 family transposase [Oligoflexia bacterium]|nr:ISL3 family transposase [Oligoflexia bacterium]